MRLIADVNILASNWFLEPTVSFLNHGSFGACPRVVLQAQQELRTRMERQPVQFLSRDLEPLLDNARTELGAFLGCDPDDLALVPNATTAVNAVLRSLDLRPGDELLVTDHAYNACRNALEFVAARAGAQVVVAHVPFPIQSDDQAADAIVAAVTPNTRVALLDHVTSPTALVLPIRRLVEELAQRGVESLVDGAHAPGMLPLELSAMGAAWYAGNCHKWLCAPKGAAFLYVRKDLQGSTRPVTISHGDRGARGSRSRFRLEFDWTGTHDPTPELCIPHALRLMGSLLPGGWSELMERNRSLALGARDVLCEALNQEPPAPDSMLGAMASVPLGASLSALEPEALQRRLLSEFSIEVPLIPWNQGTTLLRVSAQLYNHPSEYTRLAEALVRLS